MWWLSGRAPGFKSCGPQFKSRAIPTVPINFLGTVKWQVKNCPVATYVLSRYAPMVTSRHR